MSKNAHITDDVIEGMTHEETVEGHSTHVAEDGKVTHVQRDWYRGKLEAGYHLQEWGDLSTPDHALLGRYRTNQTKEIYVEDTSGRMAEAHEEITIPNPENPLEQIVVLKKVMRPAMVVVELPITVEVTHLENGHTGGPEFELTWSDGFSVTVMDDRTALQYLITCGAVTPTE